MSLAVGNAGAAEPARLTVEQILARHVEARGGAAAWRRILTMAWTGQIESGRVGGARVPFLLMFQRPNAMRFEIMAQNRRSIRIFDGRVGWKLRPTESGRPEWQDYTPEEVRFARDAMGLDGPLVDADKKGVHVVLQGTGTVDGREAYRLAVTLHSGQTRTDWIDAKTFLELRYDRHVRDSLGHDAVVSVHYRDYRKIRALVLPMTIETGDPAGAIADKMMLEKIALNPTLPAKAFAKPEKLAGRRGGVVIDTDFPSAQPASRAP